AAPAATVLIERDLDLAERRFGALEVLKSLLRRGERLARLLPAEQLLCLLEIDRRRIELPSDRLEGGIDGGHAPLPHPGREVGHVFPESAFPDRQRGHVLPEGR